MLTLTKVVNGLRGEIGRSYDKAFPVRLWIDGIVVGDFEDFSGANDKLERVAASGWTLKETEVQR